MNLDGDNDARGMMRIGLTYTGREWKHENYVRWLYGGDATVEVVRLEARIGLDAMAGCDALVLSGGVDIAPEIYGGTIGYEHAPTDGWQRERDLYEIKALEMALRSGLPVLGVCRGLQLINVVLQGDLVQDLGPGDVVHEGSAGVDKVHAVVVEGGTLFRDLVGSTRGVVNSSHHQAVGRLGEGLRVSCRAEDGTIEGIEWADPGGKPFLLGVQWHPERMLSGGVGDEAFYAEVRRKFIKEINKRDANH